MRIKLFKFSALKSSNKKNGLKTNVLDRPLNETMAQVDHKRVKGNLDHYPLYLKSYTPILYCLLFMYMVKGSCDLYGDSHISFPL